MIHLAISDSHLLCAQWSVKDGRPLLTSFSYKTLPRPLSVLKNSDTEIISVLNAGLHLIREDIPFEGNQVYVTIPDDYCQSVLVALDSEMTENDGWEFAQWTLNQRWQSDNSYEYFGRSFDGKTKSVFALRVATLFTEPIKLAIQELGGEAVWMGTESSAFYALSPEKGCTVFHPKTNGYRYYHYSQNSFQSGTARFLKEEWILHPRVGSETGQDAFKGQLIVAGQLSDKRKTHFKGRRIKQLTALEGVIVEGAIIPKEIREEDLYVLTAIATGSIQGVALNLFGRLGLQKYAYEKPVVAEKPKVLPPKPEKKTAVKTKPKPKLKKKRNILQPALYLFFFATIGFMLIYDQKPELLRLTPQNAIVESPQVDEANPVKFVSPVELEESTALKEVPDFLVKSQSLISTAIRAIELSGTHQILLLSMSDGRMDLELVGSKTMDAPIDSIGDVLNYSLRQVNGENQFKHGYLVNYPSVSRSAMQTEFSLEEFQSYVLNIAQSFLKVLDPIERENRTQIPVIARISGAENINQILLKFSSAGKNLALEKFVYTVNSENMRPLAIFYISLYFSSLPESQD